MANAPNHTNMPKVELHIHLEGAVRPSTVWDLAKKRDIKLPGSNAEEFARFVKGSEMGNLFKFLEMFSYIIPSFAADKDAIRRIAYELCEDKAREGVVYLEVRFSPHLISNMELPWFKTCHADRLTPQEVMKSIIQGIEAGQKDFKIKVRLILSMPKQEPGWAADCLALCKEFRGFAVSIDVAGEEDLVIHPEIIRVFQEAERCGIHRTVHAGEGGPASNVKQAIEVLKAERIGHGYRVLEDEAIYQMVKERDIHLELCPTSSIYTGACDEDFTKHPCIRFVKDNINFSLNTDDPTIFANSMDGEFEIAQKYFGLTDEQAVQVTMNAARSAFLPEEEKLALIQQLRAAYGITE